MNLWPRIARLTAEPPNEQACWECAGVPDRYGYMRVSVRVPGVGPRLVSVHRYVAGALMGRTLLADEEVDHRCRNPSCWNPNHLEVTTKALNMARRHGAPLGPAPVWPQMRDEDVPWPPRGRAVKRCPF